MARIAKQPNGHYQATIYVGRDENGKMLREYVTKPSLKECKVAAKLGKAVFFKSEVR